MTSLIRRLSCPLHASQTFWTCIWKHITTILCHCPVSGLHIPKTIWSGSAVSSGSMEINRNGNNKLQIVMFPWLAMGHLIPFLQLSKLLAQRGHKIFFVSTPRNLDRLPKIPSKLSSEISLVSFPLPDVPNLPPHAESSMDVSYSKQQVLKKAFDLLQAPLTSFLESTRPDWILFDYPSHWLPSVAVKLGIRNAFFSLFNAAVLSFCGPPSALIDGQSSRLTAEDFTVVPKWVPFETNVAYHLHEVTRYIEKTEEDLSGPSDEVRFALTSAGCDAILIRSSPEFEREWFNLLQDLYKNKPIVPVGFLPPLLTEDPDHNEDEKKWADIKQWLDKQRTNSVVYVALGTESALTREEISELAVGLEKSQLPFFWVLKNSPGSTQNVLEMLPDGFKNRVEDRGFVRVGWVPQVKILSHGSIGGFLTHCGWNSVIEGLALGRVLILFPVLNDQGLNARLLQGKKLGLEMPRNEQDGFFTSDTVAEMVRTAMVDAAGEPWTAAAKEAKQLFGDRDGNANFVDKLVSHLENNRYKTEHF